MASDRPPPTKRFKLEAIPDNADAATRAVSALDLDSDAVPENLRCPICEEVPLGQVLQCPNGHTICKECRTKSGKLMCSQCRKRMKTVDGGWIRCRFMEEILDSHWFLCPFRKNGCEEVLSRGDVRKHKEECFLNGKHVQICKYLNDSGEFCQYWTPLSKPEDALEHLRSHLHDFTYLDDPENGYWWFPIKDLCPNYVEGAVTFKNGGTFVIIAWNKLGIDQLSVACLRMDKPVEGQPEPRMAKITFVNQNANSTNWSASLPIVPVLEAKPVLEQKPLTVSRSYLAQHFLKDKGELGLEEGCLKIEIEI